MIDTICAIATAQAPAGLAVVRVSGPDAKNLSEELIRRPIKQTREMALASFYVEEQEIDEGLVCYFKAPSSYTGEDVVEIYCHGSCYIAQAILSQLISTGARLARPGEFTERAFLQGKIDLAQAEAVADLIASHSQAAAVASLQTLKGALSRRVAAIMDELTETRVQCEANIDFSSEDISPQSEAEVRDQLAHVLQRLVELREQTKQGAMLSQGLSLALVGPPNAGKSSLLNWLAADQIALVTDIPGTTRDVVKETIIIRDIKVQVLDTAGLRETHDQIELLGIMKTKETAQQAQCILFCVDASCFGPEDLSKHRAWLKEADIQAPVLYVLNKMDLLDASREREASEMMSDQAHVWVSVKDNQHKDMLIDSLWRILGYDDILPGVCMARDRHTALISEALLCLQELDEQTTLDIVAEHARMAQYALGQITGQVTVDDLLGKIFSQFCVGK